MNRRSWAPLVPLVVVTLLPTLVGVLYTVAASVGFFPATGGVGRFTLEPYRYLWASGDLLTALRYSAVLAMVGTAAAFGLALPLALALSGGDRWSRIGRFGLHIPLPVPHLVVALSAVQLLTQSGLVARVLVRLGLIGGSKSFPALVFDRFGIGVGLVYLWKEVPYLAVVLAAVLAGIGAEHDRVARTLGASRMQRFRLITLPLAVRGALPTLLLLFTFLVGAYEVPLVVGRAYPTALAVLGQQRLANVDLARRPEGFAVNAVLLAVTLALGLLYGRVTRPPETR